MAEKFNDKDAKKTILSNKCSFERESIEDAMDYYRMTQLKNDKPMQEALQSHEEIFDKLFTIH